MCSLVNKVQLVPGSEIVGSARYRPPFPDHYQNITIKTLLLQYRREAGAEARGKEWFLEIRGSLKILTPSVS